MKHERFSYIFIWLLLFCASVAQFGGIIVAIDMHRVLLKRKATSATKTYNLQKMLQKALLVDYALIYFLMTIPLTIVLICLICKVPYTGIMASILLVFISCHSFLGMISMCYFIKVFRVIIVNWFKLYSKKIFGTNFNTDVPKISHITNAHNFSHIQTHDASQNAVQIFIEDCL
jgi:hypothetical protein